MNTPSWQEKIELETMSQWVNAVTKYYLTLTQYEMNPNPERARKFEEAKQILFDIGISAAKNRKLRPKILEDIKRCGINHIWKQNIPQE